MGKKILWNDISVHYFEAGCIYYKVIILKTQKAELVIPVTTYISSY